MALTCRFVIALYFASTFVYADHDGGSSLELEIACAELAFYRAAYIGNARGGLGLAVAIAVL